MVMRKSTIDCDFLYNVGDKVMDIIFDENGFPFLVSGFVIEVLITP